MYILAANRSSRNNRRQKSRDITSKMIRCKSSNVWGYQFDLPDGEREGTMYIQFKNENGGAGDIYRYYDVPFQVYRKFIVAPSKGHSFWKLIRNKYFYSKLTGDKLGKFENAINY